MVKVLETNVDDQGFGGVYAFVLNVMNALGKSNPDIVFSICAFEPFEKEEHIENLAAAGIVVHDCWGGKTNFVRKQASSCLKFRKLLKREKFDCIHIHSDVAFKLFLYAVVASLFSDARVMVHSHSTNIEGRHKKIKRMLQKLCRHLLGYIPVTRLACSQAAADWMYTFPKNKEAILIKNGIDTEKFLYNEKVRGEERRVLGLSEDAFLVGTVGRFSPPKNPYGLLHIFEAFHRKYNEARLLWVGEGDMKAGVMEEAKRLGIDDSIIFYGTSEHVERLYQAMDCFILPSNFEGLSIVSIEAQAAGLPCIDSEAIPKEAKITDLLEFAPLGDVDTWCEKLERAMHAERRDMRQEIVDAGYDIEHEIGKLEKFYLER